jgi:hypothetical protein
MHSRTYKQYKCKENINRGDAPYGDTYLYDNHSELSPSHIIFYKLLLQYKNNNNIIIIIIITNIIFILVVTRYRPFLS